MEDERVLRMAAAINHYTICCMLLENVQSAHSMIDKAHQQIQQLPWIPRPLLSELEQTRSQIAALQQAALSYRDMLTQEVEDAQKELLTQVCYDRSGDYFHYWWKLQFYMVTFR